MSTGFFCIGFLAELVFKNFQTCKIIICHVSRIDIVSSCGWSYYIVRVQSINSDQCLWSCRDRILPFRRRFVRWCVRSLYEWSDRRFLWQYNNIGRRISQLRNIRWTWGLVDLFRYFCRFWHKELYLGVQPICCRTDPTEYWQFQCVLRSLVDPVRCDLFLPGRLRPPNSFSYQITNKKANNGTIETSHETT